MRLLLYMYAYNDTRAFKSENEKAELEFNIQATPFFFLQNTREVNHRLDKHSIILYVRSISEQKPT